MNGLWRGGSKPLALRQGEGPQGMERTMNVLEFGERPGGCELAHRRKHGAPRQCDGGSMRVTVLIGALAVGCVWPQALSAPRSYATDTGTKLFVLHGANAAGHPSTLILDGPHFWVAVFQSESPTFHYRDLYTVGALDEPAQEVFGGPLAEALAEDGTLFVADGSVGQVRVFDPRGAWVRSFGRQGKGPGEFVSVTSLQLTSDQESLFLYDPDVNRVTVFSRAGTRLREFAPELSPAAPLRMLRHSSGVFVFVGPVAGQRGVLHVVDSSGHYRRSMAAIVKIDDPQLAVGPARDQLSQGYVAEVAGGDLLVSLMNPYRVARITIEGRLRWLVSDDVLPVAWRGYIDFSPGVFRIRPYPIVTGSHTLGEQVFITTFYDVEKDESGYDLRHLSDGSLMARRRHVEWSDLPVVIDGSPQGGLAVHTKVSPFPRLTVARWKITGLRR